MKGFAPFESVTSDIVEKIVEDMWIDGSGKILSNYQKSFIPILTAEYVSRIEKKALKKLRENFEHE